MRSRAVQWMLMVIILGSTGYLGYVMIGTVQSNSPPPSVTTSKFEQADAGMEGFVYRQTDEGLIRWEVEAERAEMSETEHHTLLKTVQVTLFGHQGEEMRLQAEGGSINTETNEFDLRNDHDPIKIQLANGYTIFTPHIHWMEANQEISTKMPVRIQGHGLTITGVGLLGDFHSEEFTILEDVRVQVDS